jgi:hypothetical protein
MSMIGNLLRISTHKVAALRADPERISRLLYPSEDGDTKMSDDVHLDLEKSWHGIHFLLTGEVWEGALPLAFLVRGQDIGEIDVGYGPARGFDATEVRAIAEALRPITPSVLRSRFDPRALGWKEIYPVHGRALGDDEREYLISHYEVLRTFVLETADLGAGLIVYIN